MIYVLEKERTEKFKYLKEFLELVDPFCKKDVFPDGKEYVIFPFKVAQWFSSSGEGVATHLLFMGLAKLGFTEMMICL